MDKSEIALQITLKAMELNAVDIMRNSGYDLEKTKESNLFNAKLLADFYNSILNSIE